MTQTQLKNSICNIPLADHRVGLIPEAHYVIEYNEEECAITEDRLNCIRSICEHSNIEKCRLNRQEMASLKYQQEDIRKQLFHELEEDDDGKQGKMTSMVKKIKKFKMKYLTSRIRARIDKTCDGVLGIQATSHKRKLMENSIINDNYIMYNIRKSIKDTDSEESNQMNEIIDVEDISYVRKPDIAKAIHEYEAMQNHPKYTLKQVILSRRFHLYKHRFANAQYNRTLYYPTLLQPPEMYNSSITCHECTKPTEKYRNRPKGHRFIIAADTQYGILMDGFAMEAPSWQQEIDISRKCVAQINAMKGDHRPLFVCICGDLVDTEASFSGAIAR